ncbi:hypothetical protein DPEC_G00109420, partial [Dallia pectoralis]
DIDLDEIPSTHQVVPDSDTVLLRKLESAQLNRAIQESFDMVSDSLNSNTSRLAHCLVRQYGRGPGVEKTCQAACCHRVTDGV